MKKKTFDWSDTPEAVAALACGVVLFVAIQAFEDSSAWTKFIMLFAAALIWIAIWIASEVSKSQHNAVKVLVQFALLIPMCIAFGLMLFMGLATLLSGFHAPSGTWPVVGGTWLVLAAMWMKIELSKPGYKQPH